MPQIQSAISTLTGLSQFSTGQDAGTGASSRKGNTSTYSGLDSFSTAATSLLEPAQRYHHDQFTIDANLERNLFYHYILELEAHRTEVEDDTASDAKSKHRNLLVEYIHAAYIPTSSRLASLLKNREITYDLLWALFKPNVEIYTTVLDAEKLACCGYESVDRLMVEDDDEKTGETGASTKAMSVESEIGTVNFQSSHPREQPKTNSCLSPPTTVPTPSPIDRPISSSVVLSRDRVEQATRGGGRGIAATVYSPHAITVPPMTR